MGTNLAILFILLASLPLLSHLLRLQHHLLQAVQFAGNVLHLAPVLSGRVIYRFKFLLWATIVCAVFTTVAFILSQVYDQSQMFDLENAHNTSIQWSAAMFTTVQVYFEVLT